MSWKYINIGRTVVGKSLPNGSYESCLTSALPIGTSVEPYVAPTSVVPFKVTRSQARRALLIRGKLALVQPAINSIPDSLARGLAQIEWEDASEFERTNPIVLSIGAALSLDLDELFIYAETL